MVERGLTPDSTFASAATRKSGSSVGGHESNPVLALFHAASIPVKTSQLPHLRYAFQFLRADFVRKGVLSMQVNMVESD